MNSIDAGLQFQKLIWLGVILLGAVMVGALLAQGAFLLVLLSGLGIWLMLLPYHAQLSTTLAVATFSSALILPLPGRPLVWEFAALMGWTGLLTVIALRRYSPDAPSTLRRNLWLFAGLLGYTITLIVIMKYRGVGFRVFGGSQIGGRLYFQQLICLGFPLLFTLKPLSELQLTKLFQLQCLLSVTFLISDFAYSYGGTALLPLLYFFELPGDGFNFESQSLQFGIRRWQSLFLVAQAFLFLLFVRRGFSDFAKGRTAWVWAVALGLMGVGVLSGHRYLIILFGLMVVVMAWAQRFFNVQRVITAGVISSLLVGFIYLFAQSLPEAAQRAVSVLPGINVSRLARDDGDNTWQGRKDLRRLGWELAPQYRWLGRGFRKNEALGGVYDPYAGLRDPDTFFNGFVGLLVNTGLPGTTFIMIFLAAGTACSFRVINHVRNLGAEDNFTRMSSVLAAYWIATVLIFIFLHGDSEFTLRVFALPISMLLVAEQHLLRRVRALQPEVAAPLYFRKRDALAAVPPEEQPEAAQPARA